MSAHHNKDTGAIRHSIISSARAGLSARPELPESGQALQAPLVFPLKG
jgi:hypothetical protein